MRVPSGAVRQVLTSDFLVDILPLGSPQEGFVAHWYAAADKGTKGSDKFYDPTGPACKSLKISNPTPGTYNTLEVRMTSDAGEGYPSMRFYRYDFSTAVTHVMETWKTDPNGDSSTTFPDQNTGASVDSIVGQWELEDGDTIMVIDSDTIRSFYRGNELDYPAGNYRLVSDGVGLLESDGGKEEFYFEIEKDQLLIRFLRVGGLRFFRSGDNPNPIERQTIFPRLSEAPAFAGFAPSDLSTSFRLETRHPAPCSSLTSSGVSPSKSLRTPVPTLAAVAVGKKLRAASHHLAACHACCWSPVIIARYVM